MIARILGVSAVALTMALTVAAPIKFDTQKGTFGLQTAAAKHGADDPPGDDHHRGRRHP